VSAVATSPVRVDDPPATARPPSRLFEPPGGEVSLEESILGVWEDLARHGKAGCPVCGGRINAAGCDDCGSALS
jgi:hypothetical protein